MQTLIQGLALVWCVTVRGSILPVHKIPLDVADMDTSTFQTPKMQLAISNVILRITSHKKS